jgi:nucleotidyltransferase/DNA polymerase involved in DNA repair
MDAFYTSVEQRDHPAYRGKPVIVGADPKQGKGRGVVAAASYEARAFGVHSAMPISRAYRLCPGAVYLRGDMTKYGRVSHRIMEILRGYSDLVEQISIDEAFVDVSASVKLFGGTEVLAREVKKRIQDEQGLTASIGVAPNKFLAKVASDLKKPDGLVVVQPGEEEAFLRELPVEKLWGVGPKTSEKLHELGLYKISDITRLTDRELAEYFGKHGEHLGRLARGLDERPVVPEHEAKSIGHESTFAEDVDDYRVVRRRLLELAEAVARRLRKHGVEGRVVTLKYRDEHFVTETRAQTLPDSTDDAGVLFETAIELLHRIKTGDRKVRLLGISASKLTRVDIGPKQLRLFTDEEKKRRLNLTVDALSERFGTSSLKRASLLEEPETSKEPTNAAKPKRLNAETQRRGDAK